MFWQWIILNLKVGALTFGSGGSRLLMYQQEVVERRHWLSEEQFAQGMTVSQVLPGPNLVCLAAYLGAELFGLGGMLAGCVALVTPGALMIAWAAVLIPLDNLYIQQFLAGVAFASILLFSVFLLKLASGLRVGVTGTTKKLLCRYGLCLSLTLAGLCGTPIPWLILVGSFLGLVCEFSL